MRTTIVGVSAVLVSALLGAGCRDSVTTERSQRPAFATFQVPGGELSVPDGFTVNLFAEGLSGVRTLALGPGGAVFAALSGNGEIVRVVDEDQDGVADRVETVLSGLDYPFGLAFRGDTLYFAEQDAVRRLDPGLPTPVTVVAGLPRDGHVSRTIVFGPDNRLYVAIGSSCNVCDDAPPRAAVTRYNLDGSSPHTFATGLRNSVGLAFHPTTGELWANNNDRDRLGDDLPPEHLNILRDGRWYGWPQCYLPGAANPEYEGADCSGVEPPAITFPAHAAPLGLVFYTGAMFPAEYQGDAFMTYHGSWNRTEPLEPKVVRVRVENGRPTAIEDFVIGWQTGDGSRWGRPVGLLVMPDGALLVSDDVGARIWRVSVGGGGGGPPPTGPGDLEVTTATTGSNLPDAYWGVLDDGAMEGTIGANETVRVDGLAAGDHRVALEQVPEHCTVTAPNPRTVTVTAGTLTRTTFSVSCAAQPASMGTLDVTTATDGSNLPDAYWGVLDDGAMEGTIGTNETVRVDGLAAGDHRVALQQVPANCTVTAPNPRTVTVTGDAVTATTFSVRCQ
ncbi:MAG TPA: PQQ-dependent sugar dehydrogenase [Gemmatimonadales bacterium]|jgi:glucose/arabinose dehydrogenase|nr:PQQ-dependent sugar dehydrogenase [Gemmatimonadales bacterium]